MILSLFIDVKSIQVISGFNLERMKKSPDGAGHFNSGDIIVSRLVFDIFVPQRHLVIFSILFKLKPDISSIDLTSIKCDNITL